MNMEPIMIFKTQNGMNKIMMALTIIYTDEN
ncbi:hypothetical protein QF042_002820 [Pedobacter sp. W3I1]|nr:hypothetical protein [Pedobacter sp. W3I1]